MTAYRLTQDSEIQLRYLHISPELGEINTLFLANEPFIASVYPSAHGLNPGFVDVYFECGKVALGLPEILVKLVD